MTLEPAVAVMAKVPGAVTVKSRLHASLGTVAATRLYWCFLLDRLDALAGVRGIRRFVAFTPADAKWLMEALAPPAFTLVAQEGSDLGERLSNLLGRLVRRGHPSAIAIDSDSPTLPMAYVTEAAAVLDRDAADVALGPCEDGGYYLIGLRRPCPELFAGVPWSTERVLEVTLDTARRLGLRPHLLPRWFDVDTERDLLRLRREMSAGGGGPSRTYAYVQHLYREVPQLTG